MTYYSVANQYFGDSSKYTGTSDSSGLFTISGVKGAGLYVEVSKEGYYRVPDQSYASFGYGVPNGRQPPSKENPAMFVLRKKGVADALTHITSRQINVVSTGEPLNIDLSTGQAGRGNLQLESWIGDSGQRRFDWRYRLSVPDGGLVERKEEFVFEAPIDGYQPAVEVNMPANAARWSSEMNKSYFAKLPHGKYARFRSISILGNAILWCSKVMSTPLLAAAIWNSIRPGKTTSVRIMETRSQHTSAVPRAFLFVLLPAFVCVELAVGKIEADFGAFAPNSSSNTRGSSGVLFFGPFALAWITCFTTPPGLMTAVAILFIPWALLSLALVFIAPPFGLPGCFVIGLWYRYFFDVRRARLP